jgi:DNA repair protein RadC
MHRITAYRVELVRDRAVTFPRRECGGARDAADLFRKHIGAADREHMVVICLDARHRFTGIHTVAIGTLDRTEAHAREVFKAAILASAQDIILVHNHPSGDPSPSDEDVEITQGLEIVGELIGIPLIDHVVVGEHGHASMRELGLLKFDPDARHTSRRMTTDERWSPLLARLQRGAALLAGGMSAAKTTAQKKSRRYERAFVPTPDRAATIHSTISVEPDPALRPGELEPLLEELRQRIEVALQFAVQDVPAAVHVQDISIDRAADTPVFPVAFGQRTFGDPLEIAEAIDELRKDTRLDGVLHDSSGRGFQCVVWTSFGRAAEADRPVGRVFTLEGESWVIDDGEGAI